MTPPVLCTGLNQTPNAKRQNGNSSEAEAVVVVSSVQPSQKVDDRSLSKLAPLVS